MRALLAALLLAFAITPCRATQVTERVEFPTLDPAFKGNLEATIYRPAGDKRYPAMVLLHGCFGIGRSTISWAKWFADNGYEAIVVDSLGPRHVESVCDGGYPSEQRRALDAYATLAFLQKRPEVDADRIGMIGWSHGGAAVLAADDAALAKQIPGKKFEAAIALYPDCEAMPSSGVSAPLLIFTGGRDDLTPPTLCSEGVKRLERAGEPVSEHRYAYATHAFDSAVDAGLVNVEGRLYNFKYSGAAASDARARIVAFLKDTMR
ncbi:MAG: dienelactone hydrolase family protein [Candidatus Eremiobacteraeota bacterium]|nr:dienelactone hydrolase family protein [Candidatus Eremiobacteraeota bacterium]